MLILNGADAREGDKEKNTPLHIACKYGRTKNVEILLSSDKYCSNPSFKNREGNSAMHLAAMNGHWECIDLLL